MIQQAQAVPGTIRGMRSVIGSIPRIAVAAGVVEL